MPLIMEVIHTVRPATPANFEKYVVRYGEVAVPLMERCGFDLLGGFQWSTGERGRDLLLVRFDSLEHYDKATTQLVRELADPDTIKGLMELGLDIEEYVRLGDTLPYATAERLQRVLDDPPDAPRQYMLARLKAPLGTLAEALGHYSQLDKIVWLQEEPQNMGPWNYAKGHLHEAFGDRCDIVRASRDESSSPATGSAAVHTQEQAELIARTFDLLNS